jgi:amidase
VHRPGSTSRPGGSWPPWTGSETTTDCYGHGDHSGGSDRRRRFAIPSFPTLQQQARELADGSIRAVDLVEAVLDRIEASQPTLNAFRIVRRAAATEEARAADGRLAAGERLPLLGVPVAIKDDTDLTGEPTAFGCAGDFPPATADAEVVRRLRAAGAIVVGKTNTPELGQWPFTEGRAFGVTRNPWDLAHGPGGSSGGSAVAVAGGLVAGAIGSDGAGSVRIPAAWTHLVGIKGQRGRISTWPDAESFYGLTGHGPLARTVADAALLLDVASGPHPGDLHTPPPPADSFLAAASRPPGRLRIALSTRIPFTGPRAHLDPEIRRKVEDLAETLAGLGHDVTVAEPPYRLVGISFMPRSHAGLADWGDRAPDFSLLDPRTQENCRNGRRMSGALLRATRVFEGRLQRQVGRIFDRFDVVLTPTTALPPLLVGSCDGLSNWQTDKAIVAACPYAWPWNVLGWPAMSVPAGLTAAGLPIGAQLLGPADSEVRLISLAAQLEAERRWDQLIPPVCFAPTAP